MTNKFSSFIKSNLSFEATARNILLLALASLFIRSGDFNKFLIPKPFEIIFIVLVSLFFIDVIKNKKIKEFWNSVPEKIWVAILWFFISVLIGWSIALFIKDAPMNKEMVLEFGRLIIALSIFLLIFFYSRNDEYFIKKCFYALMAPVVYIFALFIPNIPDDGLLTIAGRFQGFTNNINTIYKLLLMPAMFFMTYVLFESKYKWPKFVYVFTSAGLVALLMWSSSRGALLSLIAGSLFLFFIFIFKNFSKRKILEGVFVIIAIFVLGFLLMPYSGKQNFLNRSLNADTKQIHYYGIKNESLKEIVFDSLRKDNEAVFISSPNSNSAERQLPETRLTIWMYSIKQIPSNLFGLGPAFNLLYSGTPLSGGTHNSYLQIFFEGGLISFAAFIFILFKAYQNLRNELINNFSNIIVAVSAVSISLLMALMFDANLKLFWFWALLAIAINIKNINNGQV